MRLYKAQAAVAATGNAQDSAFCFLASLRPLADETKYNEGGISIGLPARRYPHVDAVSSISCCTNMWRL